MRTGLYTKVVLAVIAIALVAIAFTLITRPSTVAAQGGLVGVEFIAVGDGFYAIDTRSGDIWDYPYEPGPAKHIGKISAVGRPLQ